MDLSISHCQVQYSANDNNVQNVKLFNISEYKVNDTYWSNANTAECWYVGYRNGPDHQHPYQFSDMYYYIQYVRLAFAIIFIVSIIFSINIS